MRDRACACGPALRILHLAATTSEADVETALSLLLDAMSVPTVEAVRDLVRGEHHTLIPKQRAPELDLSPYDLLLESGRGV